jgi:hypothetical protein
VHVAREDDERDVARDRSAADRVERGAVEAGEEVRPRSADVRVVAGDEEIAAARTVPDREPPELVEAAVEGRPDRVPLRAVPAGELRGAGHAAGEVEVARGEDAALEARHRIALGVAEAAAELGELEAAGLGRRRLDDPRRRHAADRGEAAAEVPLERIAAIVQGHAADEARVRAGPADAGDPLGDAILAGEGRRGGRDRGESQQERGARTNGRAGHLSYSGR